MLKPSIIAYASEKKIPCNWKKEFPVNGQGVLVLNIERSNPFSIVVKTDGDDKKWISLDIWQKCASFNILYKKRVKTLVTVCEKNVGYESTKRISYWFSYDRDNLVLKYGKGYRMEETTLMKYDFLDNASAENQKQIRDKYYDYFNPKVKKICEEYDIQAESGLDETDGNRLTDIEGMVEFDLNPLICNRPFLVKDSSENNLLLLDEGSYTFSASLPAGCQVLYENIKSCTLNCPEEADSVLLSDSIRHSINTTGCALYEKLQEKGLGKPNPRQTYLRVTLGNNFGKSPGIPYVLEIWPSGHFSPIHNHGNANAGIKVLFGTVCVQIYNKHVTDDEDILCKFNCKTGDITWLDRNWYQSHKLINISEDFCATLQCYNYSTTDFTHWPSFDYVSDAKKIEEFLPNTDFTFRDMRTRVMEEYKAFLKKKFTLNLSAQKRSLNKLAI